MAMHDDRLGEIADPARLEDEFRFAFLAGHWIALSPPSNRARMLCSEVPGLLDGGFDARGDARFECPDRLISVVEVEGEHEVGGNRSRHLRVSFGMETHSGSYGFGSGEPLDTSAGITIFIPSSNWSLEMEDASVETTSAFEIEILPPERERLCEGGAACLCCGRRQPMMDEDGCGICEECLAP